MGLITKVRGRVNSKTCSQNGIWTSLDFTCSKKHSCTLIGCSTNTPCCYDMHKNPETIFILLLLPLLMGRIGLLYACVIYQYPIRTIWEWTKKFVLKGSSYVQPIAYRFYKSLDKCENTFVKLNLYIMVNQIAFFAVCDKSLGLEDKQRVTSMYSLLFYNVLAYCFTYVKEVIVKEDWNMCINLTPSCQIRHLAMSATKIVLEWTKAITFIVTVVCMLLLLGLEQGLEHYKPTRFYIFITLTYYILTEKMIQDALPNFLFYLPHWLTYDKLVGLEELYSALILKSVTIGANVLMILPSFYSPRLVLSALYLNVYLQYKAWKCIKSRLEQEFQLVSQFRIASKEDLTTLDDVCAICLSPMEHARVTPCQHVFHTTCLRLCLKNLNNNMCPICKRELKLD